jgi:hypothetical protein
MMAMAKQIDYKAKKKKLVADLIESISKEHRNFGMERFVVEKASSEKPATCETASCIAGHLTAIRPRLAKKLAPQYTHNQWWLCGSRALNEVLHSELAEAIWEAETGEKCPLDFYAINYPGVESAVDANEYMKRITRKEAIAHIRGRSKKWPQFKVK